jgi:hypothetical protein
MNARPSFAYVDSITNPEKCKLFIALISKTNASGDTLWIRTYGGTGDDWGLGCPRLDGHSEARV